MEKLPAVGRSPHDPTANPQAPRPFRSAHGQAPNPDPSPDPSQSQPEHHDRVSDGNAQRQQPKTPDVRSATATRPAGRQLEQGPAKQQRAQKECARQQKQHGQNKQQLGLLQQLLELLQLRPLHVVASARQRERPLAG